MNISSMDEAGSTFLAALQQVGVVHTKIISVLEDILEELLKQ